MKMQQNVGGGDGARQSTGFPTGSIGAGLDGSWHTSTQAQRFQINTPTGAGNGNDSGGFSAGMDGHAERAQAGNPGNGHGAAGMGANYGMAGNVVSGQPWKLYDEKYAQNPNNYYNNKDP